MMIRTKFNSERPPRRPAFWPSADRDTRAALRTIAEALGIPAPDPASSVLECAGRALRRQDAPDTIKRKGTGEPESALAARAAPSTGDQPEPETQTEPMSGHGTGHPSN